MSDIIDRARRNAKVIYVAVAESVADEISGVFVDCADEIIRLRAALTTAEAERDAARQEAAAEKANGLVLVDAVVGHSNHIKRLAAEVGQEAKRADAMQRSCEANYAEVVALKADLARLQQEREGLIAAIENIRLSAASALSYGHQATQKDAREMVERKELRLRDILRFCEKAGVAGSPLRAPTPPTEIQEPTR